MLLRQVQALAWDPQHEGSHNPFGICSYYKYAQDYPYKEDRCIYIGHPQNSWRQLSAAPARRAPGRTRRAPSPAAGGPSTATASREPSRPPAGAQRPAPSPGSHSDPPPALPPGPSRHRPRRVSCRKYPPRKRFRRRGPAPRAVPTPGGLYSAPGRGWAAPGHSVGPPRS